MPAARPSLQNSACLGQHQGGAPISVGMWQRSDAPALQAGPSRSVTGRLHQFREAFRPTACKSVVAKRAGSRRLERYQRFPPVHGPVAQSKSALLSAGRLRVQVPSGPPFFDALTAEPASKGPVSASANELRRTLVCACAGDFSARGVAAICPVRDPVTAGANPAALTNFTAGWCQSSTAAC